MRPRDLRVDKVAEGGFRTMSPDKSAMPPALEKHAAADVHAATGPEFSEAYFFVCLED